MTSVTTAASQARATRQARAHIKNKPRPAPKSAVVGLTRKAARNLVVDSLTRARLWLEGEYGTDNLRVDLLNKNFSTVPILMKAYIEEHYGKVSIFDQHQARREIYELAGIPNRRSNYYRPMTLQETVAYIQKKRWSRFSELPTKLAARIDDAEWRDEVTKRVPFDEAIFDAQGRRCASRYELIARNILYALGIEFEINVSYPYHAVWNPNSKKTLDIRLISPDAPIEIWQYRCDTPLVGKGKSGTPFQQTVRAYVTKRLEKEAHHAEMPVCVISVEVTNADHTPKPLSQFARDFIGQLERVVVIKPKYKTAAWVDENWRRWSTSKVFSKSRTAKKAAGLLKRAAAQLNIPPGVDWNSITDAVQDGKSLKDAATNAGVPHGALEGICRLSSQQLWQYTATRDGARKGFGDLSAGRGSILLSLALAMSHKARDLRRETSQLERLPAPLRNLATGYFRIGEMGVFGASFRGGHHGGFIALVNQSGIDGRRTIWKSIGQRGAREAARALLSELSEALGNVLFLDRPLRRSFRLFERSRAGTVWVLLEPTEEEIHMLSSRIIRRLGLR